MVMWGGARAAQLVCVPFGCGAKQGTAEWGKNARSLTLKLSCDAISLLSVRSHRLLSCKLGAFAKLPRQRSVSCLAFSFDFTRLGAGDDGRVQGLFTVSPSEGSSCFLCACNALGRK